MAGNKAEIAILQRLAGDADERLVCCWNNNPQQFFLQWPQTLPRIWLAPFNVLRNCHFIEICDAPAIQRHTGLPDDATLHFRQDGKLVHAISEKGRRHLAEIRAAKLEAKRLTRAWRRDAA